MNLLVPSQSSVEMGITVHGNDHWFKQFWEPVLLQRFIKNYKGGQVDSMASGSGSV